MSPAEFAMTGLVVVAAILVTLLISIATWVAIVRRANEVSMRHRPQTRRHGNRVGAPLRWLASPSRPASLHRRLRAAVVAMRLSVPPPRRFRSASAIQELADEVEALAAALDHELLSIARLPVGPRSAALVPTAARVVQIESLTRRVARAGNQSDPSRLTDVQWDARADDVDDRVTALREAQAEVDDLERQLGLS
ncbi:MAG TPA: hypothetical protein VJM33_09520 [Microthrixaceae bacterium]|nr:hypothetical protein [Microthrixaceae bacterium]